MYARSTAAPLLVGFHGSFIIAGANVNMRGHVHDMPCARGEGSQPIRSRKRALGSGRSLHGMDVIVDRAQMIRIALYHRLQRGHDFIRTDLRRAINVPQAPGMQIHASFGKERGSVQVVREFVDDLPHRIAIILRSFF
jgi:hypothetical protein